MLPQVRRRRVPSCALSRRRALTPRAAPRRVIGMPERAFYSVIARRYICHACAEKAAAMPEGEKPQQTFMSTDEYSLATLPGSKSEYFPAILTANCGIDKWTLALMR